MAIKREIEVTRKGLNQSINVTYGTNILPIEFFITDFELPEGATAEVYAMGRSNKLVKQSCVISKNIISFIPEIGLFEEGKNVLQLAATYAGKDLFSFYIPVNCQKTMVYEGAQDLENDPTFVAIVMQMKEDIANKITTPEAAEVGQILEVEEVDENGKPIKFIAVDKPTGSGEGGDVGVEMTQAEYDALPEEEKNNGLYFITDGEIGGVTTKARKFLLLGDSFAGGVTPNVDSGSQKGWLYWFKEMCNSNYVIHDNSNVNMSGTYGFCSTAPFLSQLQTISETIGNKSEITDIVVLSGTNDLSYSAETIETAIQYFCEYCQANYPNALVKIGCLGSNVREIYSTVYPSYKTCTKYGATFIHDTLGLICDPQYVSSDGVHLTQEGYEFYSPYITEAIITGNTHYFFAVHSPLTNAVTSQLNAIPKGSMYLETCVTNRSVRFEIHDTSNTAGYIPCEFIPSYNEAYEYFGLKITNPPRVINVYKRFSHCVAHRKILISDNNYAYGVFANCNFYFDPSTDYVKFTNDTPLQEHGGYTWNVDIPDFGSPEFSY